MFNKHIQNNLEKFWDDRVLVVWSKYSHYSHLWASPLYLEGGIRIRCEQTNTQGVETSRFYQWNDNGDVFDKNIMLLKIQWWLYAVTGPGWNSLSGEQGSLSSWIEFTLNIAAHLCRLLARPDLLSSGWIYAQANYFFSHWVRLYAHNKAINIIVCLKTLHPLQK